MCQHVRVLARVRVCVRVFLLPSRCVFLTKTVFLFFFWGGGGMGVLLAVDKRTKVAENISSVSNRGVWGLELLLSSMLECESMDSIRHSYRSRLERR